MSKPQKNQDLGLYSNAFNQKDNSAYFYQATDIRTIQAQIMQGYFSNFRVYEPIGNGSSALPILKKLINSLAEDKSTLCVYNLNNSHWVVFAALKVKDQITILYKDSRGDKSQTLEEQIKAINSKAVFIAHTVKEQISGVDCGPFALENMRIMADQLKSNRDYFIESFKFFKGFCSLKHAQTLREGEFAEQYVIGTSNEMAYAAMKAGKLQKIREYHSSEEVEIAKRLQTIEFFKDKGIKIIALSKKERVPEAGSVIFIEVSTNVNTNPEDEDYSYGYRISFSKNLNEIGRVIADNVKTVFPSINIDPVSFIVRLDASKVLSIPKPKLPVEKSKTPPINITELLKNLKVVERPLEMSVYNILKTKGISFISELQEKSVKPDKAESHTDYNNQAIRKKCALYLKELSELPEEQGFKVSLRKFIEKIAKVYELDKPCQDYHTILKKELEQHERDPAYEIDQKAIEAARVEFFSKAEQGKFDDLITVSNQKSSSDNETPKIINKLEQEYGEEYKKFIEIITFVCSFKQSPKVDKVLDGISTNLGLDPKHLRKFFDSKKDKPKELLKKDKTEKEQSNNLKPENIDKVLAKIKSIQKLCQNSDSGIKPIEQLFTEIELLTDSQKEKLESSYKEVKKFCAKWSKEDGMAINKWALDKKGKLSYKEVDEAIAVMDRANELITGGHHLRDTQILSVLAFLSSDKDMGRLCQIQTGEGKTIITAVLAAIKVLQGEKVDVITSNAVLAAEAVKDKDLFFELLGITARHNNVEESDKSSNGPKECYKADIVYGNITNFQFDYLRDSFEGYGTRNNRGFEKVSVILDEVDNMLVDNGGTIAKLSTPFPGMEALRYVYIKIWQELVKGEEVLTKQIDEALRDKAQQLQKVTSTEDTTEEIAHSIAQQDYEEFSKELYSSFVDKLKDYIRKSNPLELDLIPEHLKDYAKNQLNKWIDNAIYAKYHCHENHHYVLRTKSKNTNDNGTKTKELAEEINQKNASNQKNEPGYWYQATDIEPIQNEVMKKYSDLFRIHSPLSDMSGSDDVLIRLLQDIESGGKTTLCVYNINHSHWVVFACLKVNGKLTVLYKDSYGKSNKALAEKVEQVISGAEFISNTTTEQTDGVDCGIFAIKNMEILAQKIIEVQKKNDSEEWNNFIDSFKGGQDFCSLEEARELRKNGYAESYTEGIKKQERAETIKKAKLTKLRENHDSETIEIADRLKEIEALKEFTIKSLSAEERLADKITKTITIQISTAPEISTETADYQYHYCIRFSKDLEDQISTIVNAIPEELRGDYTQKATIIRVNPDHVQSIAKIAKKAVRDQDIDITKITAPATDLPIVSKENQEGLGKKQSGGTTKAEDEYLVVPVDYSNTGITMRNTIWSDALHQFVQLKHNLHLTSESLTSSYISNISYIKKYGNKIYGLTGTLGSEAEQELISSVYNVDYCKIPVYKPKQFLEDAGIVVADNDWETEITVNALERAISGRAVLIICQTIQDVDDIVANLENIKHAEKLNIKVKSYRDESQVAVTKEHLNSGDIVVATNISGRGTDFKISNEIEDNGGLHVCIGFLPCNKRVEDQAFGRTSRQGKEGTAQLIIRSSELAQFGIDVEEYNEQEGEDDFSAIKELRDEAEKLRIANIGSTAIQKLLVKDKLFSHFSDLYNSLKDKTSSNPQKLYALKDLKEFWAFWLKKQDFSGIKSDDDSKIEKLFASFKLDASEIIEGNIKHNPYYSIALAEAHLQQDNIKKAEKALNNAITISKNPEILYTAYYKLFEIAIEKGGILIEKFKDALAKVAIFGHFYDVKNEQYKEEAIKHLKQAKSALTKEIDYLKKYFPEENIDKSLETLVGSSSQGTSFVKHLRSKLEALRIYQSTIEHLIQEVENPKKNGLAINSRIPDYLIKLKPSTEEEVQLKKIVGVTELMELQNIGLDTIYALREVPDASPEIIALAQGQIAGGIALLSAFPPAAIITTSIASTMISEGITDIAMELILKGQPGLNWAYAKAKAISYGISIITGCIAKLAQWEKVMKASIKACKSISNVLKKSPVMTKLCTNIADKIEKLGKWLEKVHEVSKFNQLSKVKQLEQLENLRKAGDLEKFTTLGGLKTLQDLQKLEGLGKLKDLSKLHTVAKLTGKAVVSGVKGVATSVAMEKIVIAPLQEIMQGIKPRLKETIKESINKNIDKEAVISATNIEEALIKAHKQTTGEIISEVAYEIALGLTRPYGDWRVKAGYLAVDSILSSYKMYNYTEEFCKKFNENLTKGEVVKNDIEKIIEKLAEQLSETVFGMVVSSTGKIAVNLPGIIKGAAGAAYKKHQKKKEEQIKREQDEIAKLEKDVAQQQQHEAERIKAGKEPKECVGLTLDSLNPAGRSEDGLGPKTQSEVRELIENRLAKDGSKAYEENLGTLNRKEILNALKKHGGSEGMLLLSREDGSIGHAVKVQKVGSKLILVDPQSGKVMDHQHAKAYFSEHNYSKAAVMGVQPAGFKEGIGQKSVRKFKELTGIDAGPGKPFDKDIEFAGKPGCKKDQEKAKAEAQRTKSLSPTPPNQTVIAKDDDPRVTISYKGKICGRDRQREEAIALIKENDDFLTHSIIEDALKNKCHSPFHLDTKYNGKCGKTGLDKYATEIQMRKGKDNITTIGVVHYTSSDSPDLVRGGLIRSIEAQGQATLIRLIEAQGQATLNGSNYNCKKDINSINNYFASYTLNAIQNILKLRFKDADIEYVKVLENNYIFLESYNNILDMCNTFSGSKPGVILAPLNLYNKHAVGFICIKEQSRINLYYIDPTNDVIPEKLKDIILREGLNLEQLIVEDQAYGNCGPEVIENFILYLTGERLSQEEAVPYHSELLERELLDVPTGPVVLSGDSAESIPGGFI